MLTLLLHLTLKFRMFGVPAVKNGGVTKKKVESPERRKVKSQASTVSKARNVVVAEVYNMMARSGPGFARLLQMFAVDQDKERQARAAVYCRQLLVSAAAANARLVDMPAVYPQDMPLALLHPLLPAPTTPFDVRDYAVYMMDTEDAGEHFKDITAKEKVDFLRILFCPKRMTPSGVFKVANALHADELVKSYTDLHMQVICRALMFTLRVFYDVPIALEGFVAPFMAYAVPEMDFAEPEMVHIEPQPVNAQPEMPMDVAPVQIAPLQFEAAQNQAVPDMTLAGDGFKVDANDEWLNTFNTDVPIDIEELFNHHY